MPEVKFEVNEAFYKSLLEKGIKSGTFAVAEQLLADSDEFVKWDTGTMKDSGRPEHEDSGASVSMQTPYVIKQYYTGRGINHGHNANPGIMWFHKTADKYKSDYQRIMQKFFGEGLK